MRDVLALARLADPVALDGPGENDRWLAGVLDGGLVSRIDLDRVVAAEREFFQLLVGEMRHHLEQFRMGTPEMLADVVAGLDGILLILAVDDLAHAPDEESLAILLEERVPFAPPDHLDDVPAGPAEDRLELLDNLPVAAHRPVEPLQVAVDDKDQVVELFTRRERDGAKRFGLVGLTIAKERPDLGVGPVLQATVFQIAHEPRLVD